MIIMNNCDLIGNLTYDLWERLKDSLRLGINQSEETLTDILLLEIERRKCFRNSIQSIKIPKHLENKIGADWEWWIQKGQKWLRISIQAKKLNAEDRYDQIGKKAGQRLQADILKDYADLNNSVPIYCFYNYKPSASQEYWNCPFFAFEQSQLGWTFIDIETVRYSIKTRNKKTFEFFHRESKARPVRCLFCCPSFEQNELVNIYQESPDKGAYSELPEQIKIIKNQQSAEYPFEFFNSQSGLFPKRITIFGQA